MKAASLRQLISAEVNLRGALAEFSVFGSFRAHTLRLHCSGGIADDMSSVLRSGVFQVARSLHM